MVSVSSEKMPVGEMGETELLRRILPRLASVPQGVHKNAAPFNPAGSERGISKGNSDAAVKVIIGPGDDAALVRCEGDYTFISTDTLVEDYDFRRLWPCGYRTMGYDLGWKTMVQNIADISAMGGLAAAVTLALSLPRDLEVSWVENFADGIREAIAWFSSQTGESITVIGGDLGAADRISVTATILGVPVAASAGGQAAPLAIRRDGAREGDIIAVSQGNFSLGSAHIALKYLETRGRMPELSLFQPQLRPAPDFSAVFSAVDANAMIDTSDGLIHEVKTLIESSVQRRGMALQAQLDDEALAGMAENLGREMRCNFDAAIAAVLSGGEDHLLVASFAADSDIPENFTPFGVISCPSKSKSATLPVVSEYLPRAVVFDHFYQRNHERE